MAGMSKDKKLIESLEDLVEPLERAAMRAKSSSTRELITRLRLDIDSVGSTQRKADRREADRRIRQAEGMVGGND